MNPRSKRGLRHFGPRLAGLAAAFALVAAFAASAQPVKATALLGAVVQDAQGEVLGYVTDLAINLSTNRVRYAMVYAHARTTMGSTVYGVPPADLRPAMERGHLVVRGTPSAPPPATPKGARMIRASSLLGGKVVDLWIDLASGQVVNAVTRRPNGEEAEVPLGALDLKPASAAASR